VGVVVDAEEVLGHVALGRGGRGADEQGGNDRRNGFHKAGDHVQRNPAAYEALRRYSEERGRHAVRASAASKTTNGSMGARRRVSPTTNITDSSISPGISQNQR